MPANLERLSCEPAFQALFKLSRHRHYPRNHVVIAEGAKPEHLYLMMAGLAAVRHCQPRAEEMLLAYLYPGDFFGEMCLFPGVECRSAMIRTCTECSALEIGYDHFLELTRRHSDLWLELAGQLAARLRATSRRLAEMPVLHAADRVWLVLSEMAARAETPTSPQGTALQVTRQDLGKLAGCSRELAGMILKDLARAGRIKLCGRTVIVPRIAAAEAAPDWAQYPSH